MKPIDTWPPQILENAASLLVPRPCSRRRTTVSTKAYDARSMEFVVANDTSQYPNGLPAGNRLGHGSPHARAGYVTETFPALGRNSFSTEQRGKPRDGKRLRGWAVQRQTTGTHLQPKLDCLFASSSKGENQGGRPAGSLVIPRLS